MPTGTDIATTMDGGTQDALVCPSLGIVWTDTPDSPSLIFQSALSSALSVSVPLYFVNVSARLKVRTSSARPDLRTGVPAPVLPQTQSQEDELRLRQQQS